MTTRQTQVGDCSLACRAKSGFTAQTSSASTSEQTGNDPVEVLMLTTSRHRYNLKRKIAELPPVTAEVFAQKVLGIPWGLNRVLTGCYSTTRSSSFNRIASELSTNLYTM